jgi:predicted MFS family arabinose efflux permease
MLNVLLVKMAIDWFAGREMVTAMAVLMSSWPLGISLGLVILPPLATATSWQMAMGLTAALCVASVLLVMITYRPAPNAVSGETPSGMGRWLGMRELGLVGLAATIWALFTAGFASLPSFGPAFLTSSGYTGAGAGALIGTAIWISIPSVLVGGYLADRLGRPSLVMLSCFIAGGLILALLPSMPEQIALFVAFGLIIGVPAGNIMALAPSILRPKDRATGMGIFYTCNYGLSAASAVLAGWSRDLTHAPAAPIYFGAGVLFAAVLVLALFRAFEPRHVVRAINEPI